ncbi:cytochrome P450 [Coprinopsis cinerea okayama7|uniref:Cytochrome P450 n=1 Tax=Coprinopsis cinerea (strain Okayama-7 / 130 / ATCC MYA-4618 / FGSC 9003) TaxID=240176 RepID=A8N1M8_COPC7|nr:cytochrome P450 [Coprinopsis cinerea okayama7\|eukprot:XP_001828801.2 cytochrome P450 [Coprinopsis cinerea okayama7\
MASVCALLVPAAANLAWGFVSFAILLGLYYRKLKTSLPLPPGPPSSLFRGPTFPSPYPWVSYAKWAEVYGDLIYYKTLGNPVLVLNSREAMTDLLDKRASIYSSRPYRTMVIDMIGLNYLFTSMLYGERWKYFKRADRNVYNAVQTKYVHTMLRELLENPTEFRASVRRTASAVVLGLVYGHEVAEEGDLYVDLAEKVARNVAQAGLYGTYMVDYIPWLKHIPSWFPLASFKRKAKEWRKPVIEMLERPFAVTKSKMLEGKATACLVREELDDLWSGTSTFTEDIIKNTAATAFAAGSDTVVSGALSYFLALANFPEVQKLAQEELDRVLGGRLPTLQDRPDLPLIESICYEVLRWNPVTPLSLSHYASETDEYRGYHIPKGTVILPNVWAVLHDPDLYPDPFTFKADRFVDREANARLGINALPDNVFGFGRRFCPGQHVAFDFIFLVVSSLSSVFDVTKAVDKNGRVVEPVIDYAPLVLSVAFARGPSKPWYKSSKRLSMMVDRFMTSRTLYMTP